MGQRHGVRSVLRKIIVTSLFGALSYPLTNLLFESQAQQLAMSAAVGAVALVVQLLVEVEQRLAAVETNQVEHAETLHQVVAGGFKKVNVATKLFGDVESIGLSTDSVTQLARKAVELGANVPPVISTFAQAEIERVSKLLSALSGGESTTKGEDHGFLLTLTELARGQIDAVSLFTVDAGDQGGDGGFWGSPPGRHYLDQQREAIARGVTIRRVFIVEGDDLAEGDAFRQICRKQAEYGITIGIVVSSDVPRYTGDLLKDYILFDNAIIYEVEAGLPVPGKVPLIVSTRLVCERRTVADRVRDYAKLWEIATGMPNAAPVTRSAS